MKAMIFAAGIGSRLKELTATTPKCLMPIGETTILAHVINKLKSVGVDEVVINTHHLANLVVEYLTSQANFGVKVHFSHEDILLDTGGGLQKMRHIFAGERAFFVHNSDIYYAGDLSDLLQAHLAKNAVATLGIMPIKTERGLYFDAQRKLTGWSKQHTPQSDADTLFDFSGITVCSDEIFKYMDAPPPFSIITPLLQAARATERVFGADINPNQWVDIGTPERLNALRASLAKMRL